MTAIDTAVWWTEYVLRNRGAPTLRSPAVNMSWIEFLMIDVLLMLYFVLFVAYWLVKKSFKYIFKGTANKHKKE